MAITIRTRKRRNKYDPLFFNISGVNREDLGLLISFAEDGVVANPRFQDKSIQEYTRMMECIKRIENYINNEDETVRSTPLILK